MLFQPHLNRFLTLVFKQCALKQTKRNVVTCVCTVIFSTVSLLFPLHTVFSFGLVRYAWAVWVVAVCVCSSVDSVKCVSSRFCEETQMFGCCCWDKQCMHVPQRIGCVLTANWCLIVFYLCLFAFHVSHSSRIRPHFTLEVGSTAKKDWFFVVSIVDCVGLYTLGTDSFNISRKSH